MSPNGYRSEEVGTIQEHPKIADGFTGHVTPQDKKCAGKVIYDFVQFVVDKGQPLTCVDDEFFRKLVYRSHGVQSISNPVCKKTVREVLIELMTLIQDRIGKFDKIILTLSIYSSAT